MIDLDEGNPMNQFPTRSDDAMRSYRVRNLGASLRVLILFARPEKDLWEQLRETGSFLELDPF